MSHRFPKNVRVTIKPASTIGDHTGHDWEVRDTSGFFLTGGWSAGTKADARKEAWDALEQIGLAVDE